MSGPEGSASASAAPTPRDPRLVLIVRDTMEPDTLQAITSACTRARARARLWGDEPALDAWPALVVAALPAGTRRISDELVDLLDRRFPGTPLLLACDEPLTRPTITLQAGRLTLVEPPLTQARMVSRVRLLLSEPAHDEPRDPAPLPSPAPGQLQSRELRQRLWWAAELLCAGRAGDSAAAPAQPWLAGGETLTALLTPADGVPPDLDRALDIVRHGAQRSDDGAALEQALGPDIGLVHLSRHSQDWIIYWPSAERPLWLFSPLRLPRWSDLTQQHSAGLCHLPAASGDILVALSSRALFGGPPPTEVSAAMLAGGPALVDLIEARLTATPQPLAGLFVEVR